MCAVSLIPRSDAPTRWEEEEGLDPMFSSLRVSTCFPWKCLCGGGRVGPFLCQNLLRAEVVRYSSTLAVTHALCTE